MALEIVEIYGGGGVGGAAQHLRLLVAGLKERGVAVRFVSLPPHSVAAEMTALVPTVRAGGLASARASLLAFAERARRGEVLLHAHGTRALTAALAAGLPFVRTVHSFLAHDYPDPLRRLFAYRVDAAARRRALRTLTVSEALREDVLRRGAPPERVVTVHNGVAPPPPAKARAELLERFGWASPGREPVVLFMAARLDPVKGVDRAVRALAHLPEAVLLVFGQGPEEAALRRLAGEEGVAPRVAFPGFSREARAFLGAADVVLMPSRQEGLPMTAVEAMAAGVPVVASDLPGLREALGDAGVFTEAEPAAIAAGVREALSRRAELAARGKQRYRTEFAYERFVERTLAELEAAARLLR